VFVVGVVLFLVGVAVQRFGARIIHAAMPPIVTGAVVMLIGFNLAPVTAATYWPQDQWTPCWSWRSPVWPLVCLRCFFSRVAILPGLVFGYASPGRSIGSSADPLDDASGEVTDHWRLNLSGVRQGRLGRAAVLPRAVVPVVGDPGRATGGDRAGRRETPGTSRHGTDRWREMDGE